MASPPHPSAPPHRWHRHRRRGTSRGRCGDAGL